MPKQPRRSRRPVQISVAADTGSAVVAAAVPVGVAMVLHIPGLVALGGLRMGSLVSAGLLVFGPTRTGPR